MKQAELIERNLSIDENGRVLDEDGNEYRDENGEMQYLETEPLTAEQKADYLASGGTVCPYCESGDITTLGNIEVNENGAVQAIECEGCSEIWQDVYSLTGIEEIK